MKKILFISFLILIAGGCLKKEEISEFDACIDSARENAIIDMGKRAKSGDNSSEFINQGLDDYDSKEKECYDKYK